MSIQYSLVPRSSNLGKKDAPWLVYAAAQSTETVDTLQIAHHLASHNSPFSEGTIVGLLLDAQKCIVEMLKQGARVDLGMLGAFYTTLTGRGAASPEEFTPDLVDRINVRWRPSKEMTTSLQRTPLKEVLNRAYQREVKRREKSQLNEAMEQTREND